MTNTSEKVAPDTAIAEILKRWSVTDLIEQKDSDLERGDERFYNSAGSMEIVDSGKHGLISYWKILSDGKFYECRRYKNFVFCSCKSFFFSKKVCKHLARTARVMCANCHEMPVKSGKYCTGCNHAANFFLKPSH